MTAAITRHIYRHVGTMRTEMNREECWYEAAAHTAYAIEAWRRHEYGVDVVLR